MTKKHTKLYPDGWISEFFSVENDWKRRENAAFKKGYEQGFKQGIEQINIEIAKNILRIGTISIEDISECTGLDIEKVKQLSQAEK